MQISAPAQVNGIVTTQPSLSQPAEKPADPQQAPQADRVSLSAEAIALARSEVNESVVAESAESTATQIKEGEFSNKPAQE